MSFIGFMQPIEFIGDSGSTPPPDGPVSVPSGFDWTPPVTVYRSGSAYSTDFNAESWKSAATASLYVSTSGNDTTGTGTIGAPYRGIRKALAVASALPDASINIFVAAGIYDRRYNWDQTACDKNVNVIATGGQAVSSCRYEALSWSLNASGTYQATRSAVSKVWDEAFPDSDGIAQPLALQASLANCQAIPGSWYQSGGIVYVHTNDGRSPDASLLVLSSTIGPTFNFNKAWYYEGFVFEGGATGAFQANGNAIGASAQLVQNNCVFRYAYAGLNGAAIVGVPLVISNNCSAYANDGDGFNYHQNLTTLINVKAIEIDCLGYRNGNADGVNNDNGSTSHENSRVMRVNGGYRKNIGPNIADINTSQAWNLGCSADSSLSSSPNGTSNSGFLTANSVTSWLDGCNAEGSYYAAVAVDSSSIKVRSSTLDGQQSGSISSY